jgi:type IV pilus assembly protein PilV
MTHLTLQSPASRPRSRGFTLIEVLVSLVVLSIGLLGIGKLVLFSARANDSAYLRGQATEMAYEILDSMRANRAIAVTQGYDTAMNAVPTNPGSCISVACPPAALSLYDVYIWKQRVQAALPSGQAMVQTAGNPTTATITVQWDDAAAQSTFGASNFGAAAPVSVVLETIL